MNKYILSYIHYHTYTIKYKYADLCSENNTFYKKAYNQLKEFWRSHQQNYFAITLQKSEAKITSCI